MVLHGRSPQEVTVLVVDDNPDDVLLISRVLSRAGFDNSWACPRGEDALDWVSRNPTHLMVLEYHLPGINGLQVMEKMSDRHIQLPTIVLARQLDLPSVVRLMKLGAADFLVKDDSLSSALGRSVQLVLRSKPAEEEEREETLPDSGRDRLSVAIAESQWLLKAYKGPNGSKFPQPGNREDVIGNWEDVVEVFRAFMETSLRIFPEIVRRDEDSLVSMLVQRGLSPRDTVTLYQLALYALKQTEPQASIEVRVGPGIILARLLARMTEEYQRSISEQWLRAAS